MERVARPLSTARRLFPSPPQDAGQWGLGQPYLMEESPGPIFESQMVQPDDSQPLHPDDSQAVEPEATPVNQMVEPLLDPAENQNLVHELGNFQVFAPNALPDTEPEMVPAPTIYGELPDSSRHLDMEMVAAPANAIENNEAQEILQEMVDVLPLQIQPQEIT